MKIRSIRSSASGTLLAGLLIAVPQAGAAPLAVQDADDFAYRWDFDLTAPDLDANFDVYNNTTGAPEADGNNDWSKNTLSTGVSISDGALVMEETLNPAIGIDNLIWGAAPGLTATSGYTLEIRLKIDTTPGANGLTLYPSPNGGGVGAVSFKLAADSGSDPVVDVYWYPNGNGSNSVTAAQKKATLSAADFFTVRIAAAYDVTEEALVYSLYVNDALVADALSKSGSSTADRLLIGKVGGSHSGRMRVDYLAFTPGAYAPVSVPDPGALSLLGLGICSLLMRRRP